MERVLKQIWRRFCPRLIRAGQGISVKGAYKIGAESASKHAPRKTGFSGEINESDEQWQLLFSAFLVKLSKGEDNV